MFLNSSKAMLMVPTFRFRCCILPAMVPWPNSGQERRLKGLNWAERYSDHPYFVGATIKCSSFNLAVSHPLGSHRHRKCCSTGWEARWGVVEVVGGAGWEYISDFTLQIFLVLTFHQQLVTKLLQYRSFEYAFSINFKWMVTTTCTRGSLTSI